jgi:5-methylthioadenosine/S-adenosylhomocysteine deaminase
MGRIFIKNGTVITMDPRRRIIADGAVAIENDRIVDIGKAEALKDFQADTVFDASGRIVMPGLIDAHCHNVQMLARGLGDDVDLIAWCYDRIFPYETLLTDEATYLSALLCSVEMIRTGTTCVCDPGGYRMDNVGRALTETGMRGIIAWAGMDQWSEDRALPDKMPGKLSTEETLRVEEKLVKDWNGREGGRIRACYGLRVEPNVSDNLYRGINQLAKRDGVMVEMHAAVNKDQVEWVKKRTGHTVIEHMNSLGILGDHWYLIHMAVLTDEELKMLKDNDCRVIHVPGATLHGAYGSATVGKFPELIDMGVTVGLGCDSSAANNSIDMFRAMYDRAQRGAHHPGPDCAGEGARDGDDRRRARRALGQRDRLVGKGQEGRRDHRRLQAFQLDPAARFLARADAGLFRRGRGRGNRHHRRTGGDGEAED